MSAVDTLNFRGNDLRGLLDVMRQAVEITSSRRVRPAVVVNGKRYQPFELLKVAGLLPADCKGEGYSLAQKANNIAGQAASAQRARAFAASEMERLKQ